jgi:hypothetical protein
MAKLSDHGRVEQKTGEVAIIFEPKVPFTMIKDLVNECASGTCSCGCDPQKMGVEEFVAENGPEGAVIHLKGEQVGAQEVEEHFNQCDVSIPTDQI